MYVCFLACRIQLATFCVMTVIKTLGAEVNDVNSVVVQLFCIPSHCTVMQLSCILLYLAFLFRYQLRLVRIFAQSLCVLSFLNYGQFVCLRIILCVYFCLFHFDVVHLIVYQCSVVSCLDVLVSRTTRYVSSWTLNSARSLTQDRLIDCVKVA